MLPTSSRDHVLRENRGDAKVKASSLLVQRVKVQYSILINQRWFRVLGPWMLATCWLVYGVLQQRRVVNLARVEAQFPVVGRENITHWCYLNREKTGRMHHAAIHIPYAVEWVAGCWSWMEAHNWTTAATTDPSAAIALDESVYRQFLVDPNHPHWNLAFFHALGIPVARYDEPPSVSSFYYTKPFGRATWFGNAHSCYSFRERLWESLGVRPPPSSSSSSGSDAVRIGFVERPSRRRIFDSAGLAEGLQKHYANATVSYRIIADDTSLADQAGWFASQDMVIMAHGAGTTNLVFMRPDAQLLELFPVNYFSERFQSLAQQCGIHHDWFYAGGANPQQDSRDHRSERLWHQEQDIRITPSQLRARVDQMIANAKQY